MYPAAKLFPRLEKVSLPLSRDQAMLLVAALNEIMLGVETYIAHLISGTIVPYEWIPILFGPIAGMLLLLAGVLARYRRSLATVIATLVFSASILVGLLGAYFHLVRAILPYAQSGERFSVPLLVWAPPILGPLTFALVGLLGISAAWIEDPPDSGSLILLGGKRLHMPYSKTRAYLFLVGLGSFATVISSVLDHARTDFSNPWLWVPTSIGVFSTVVSIALGALDDPGKGDFWVYSLAMVAMLITGVLGSGLHILENLTSQNTIIGERFLRGAPFLAPLLFSDMGMMGLVTLMNPVEPTKDTKEGGESS